MNNGNKGYNSLTYMLRPFKKGKFEFKQFFESKKVIHRSINTAKLLKNHKNKDFFYQKQKLFNETEKYFSSINKNSNILTHVNSAIIKTPKASQISLFSALISKSVNKNRIFSGFFQKKNKIKNKNKRNYSAYYINSDLRLKKNYITDLLLNNEDNPHNKTQKISDIEKKINILEKYLNIKKNKSFFIEKSLKIKKKEEEENIKEKELPDYLKEEFKIKGTNILSPFCMKSRDKFIMDKFRKFLNKSNTLKTDKKYIIDNKLNIIYAENEEMYENKLKKINQQLISQGKKERYRYIFSPSERQLRDMEKKVTFMKDIVNVAYPNTAMLRLRDTKSYLKKYKTSYKKFEAMYDKKNNEDDEVKNNFFELKIK